MSNPFMLNVKFVGSIAVIRMRVSLSGEFGCTMHALSTLETGVIVL